MEKIRFLIAVIILCSFRSVVYAQNVSPHFSEIRGMEDNQGNTHLLYRIYTYQQGPDFQAGTNNIYNLVPGTSIDTIYFYDYFSCGPFIDYGITILDYDYWDNDLTKFIISGNYVTCLEPAPFISRFDSVTVYLDWSDYADDIFISKQNDSLVFGLPNLISYNGGFNWDTLNLDYHAISVSPINDSIMFAVNFSYPPNSNLYKSIDRGNIYNVVDTGGYNWQSKFYYDIDGSHIYRTNRLGYTNCSLKRSSNQGNAFTWQTLYETPNELFICLDESQSGAIYLADGNKIMFSSNYGTTFNLYKELDKKIIGIYKKPNSDKLYAATKYKLYEITNNSITVIKSLPIPQEILDFYPLAVGNRWVYDYTILDWNMNGSQDIFFREVVSEKVKQNGKNYFEILEKYINSGVTDTVYERIDSLEGKVYRFEEFCPNQEQLIEDLVMEVNDSSFASRFEYCIEHAPTELSSEQNYNQWGLYGLNRNYLASSLLTADYNLYSQIGLVNINLSDDNYFKTYVIKGMLKDGIVYGDTTLTDVDDQINGIPTTYMLDQNFPNPFNPSTKITYEIPVQSNVLLRVYDIIGNEVATLVHEPKPAGIYHILFDATSLSSGVYFYRMQAGDYIETKKMIYLK
jgi:hypothetical protein